MRDSYEVIEQLSPADALSILWTLAKSDEKLARRIAEAAMEPLSGVDPEAIAGVLYDDLDSLEVEEAWDRAGRTRYGYVEPQRSSKSTRAWH